MNTLVRRIISILFVLALTVGIIPIVVSAQDSSCDEGMSLFALNGAIFVADDGTSRSLTEGQMVIASAPNGDMVVVCLPDTGETGQVTSVMLTTDQLVLEQLQSEVSAITGPVLDGDEQTCDREECSFDVGVNFYTDEDAVVQQVGMAWGSFVSWDGELTEGDSAFVTLLPGWYLDLTLRNGGAYRVYNIPKAWTQQQIDEFIASIANEVMPGAPIVVWDSEIESVSNSAAGAEGVGPGDDYPQLDGQQFSAFPQLGPQVLNVTVAEERQIGILFGVQLSYQQLAGPQNLSNPENSLRDTQYRCDMAILEAGTYDGVIIRDGRVEVYNVPQFDQAGWFRNLVAERAEEQSIHYGCPQHEAIPIWSADGTSTEEYILRWEGIDATAGGPNEVSVTS